MADQTLDIHAMRARLQARRAELAAELRGDAEQIDRDNYAALSGEVGDAGDRSVADLIADTGKAQMVRDMQEFNEVEAALARLDGGDYGLCEDCGVEIAAARLQVQPTAWRCVRCQQRHEKTFDTPERSTM